MAETEALTLKPGKQLLTWKWTLLALALIGAVLCAAALMLDRSSPPDASAPSDGTAQHLPPPRGHMRF
jgi:hypothetical protein